jgi:hypothetical protein
MVIDWLWLTDAGIAFKHWQPKWSRLAAPRRS